MTAAALAVVLLVGLALGLVLGLLGGGGGILAIPAFIHILGMPVDEASTTSLVVVAIGAAAGLIPHALGRRVAWRIGLLFGALGTVGSIVGARLALVADDRLQLAGLIGLIFLAASGMLRNADDSTVTRMRHRIRVGRNGSADPPGDRPDLPSGAAAAHLPTRAPTAPLPLGHAPAEPAADPQTPGPQGPVRWLSPRVLASASMVGLVTGFFGVGGGFVAVPALMWGARLPVRMATATGLVVIVLNSLVALTARGTGYLPWPTTGQLAAAAVVGAVIGAAVSRRVPARTLKQAFGWLLLVIGFHELWQLALLY